MLEMQTIKDRGLVSLRLARRPDVAAVSQLQLAAPLARINSEPGSIWLSPVHWLMMSDTLNAEELIKICNVALEGVTHNATNNTDEFVTLRLSGPSVRELLSSGSGLDFRAKSFSEGMCQRTRFAQVKVVICAYNDNQFELIFDRSYDEYLRSWIEESDSILQAVIDSDACNLSSSSKAQ